MLLGALEGQGVFPEEQYLEHNMSFGKDLDFFTQYQSPIGCMPPQWGMPFLGHL